MSTSDDLNDNNTLFIAKVVGIIFTAIFAYSIFYAANYRSLMSGKMLFNQIKVGSTIKNGIILKLGNELLYEELEIPDGEWEVINCETIGFKESEYFLDGSSNFTLLLKNKNTNSDIQNIKIQNIKSTEIETKNENGNITHTLKKVKNEIKIENGEVTIFKSSFSKPLLFSYVIQFKNRDDINKMQNWIEKFSF